MYVKSIIIKDLRCFSDVELELQYPDKKNKPQEQPILPNINLLVGDNGAGKTTVLRALALAALAHVMPQSGFYPYRLVRRAGTGEIKTSRISAKLLFHAQDLGVKRLERPEDGSISIDIERKGRNDDVLKPGVSQPPAGDPVWERMYEESPAFFIVGYGAARRIEDAKNVDRSAQQKARRLRYQRVAGLFESVVALVPLSQWLPSLENTDRSRYKEVVELIDQLLPDEATFTGEYRDDTYFFEVNGVPIPFEALSDGYHAYIGWIGDLLYHLCMGETLGLLADKSGIVLVDEIDLHLHPEWQRSVTASLSAALPNMQFVFTTHSPIVTGSLTRENIFVMETNSESGESSVRQYKERVYGLDAEEVLLSSYFNLNTTRAETFTTELRELSGKAALGDKEAAFDFAERLAKATPDPSDLKERPERRGRAGRRRLVFVGPFDKVLRKGAQISLLIIAAICLGLWAAAMFLPGLFQSGSNWTFRGGIHALLGGAIVLIVEVAIWTISRRARAR